MCLLLRLVGLDVHNAMADFKESTVRFADTPNFDAFSRLRVSQAHSLFDSQFTYDLQPLLWEQITSGGGASIAYNTTNNAANLTLTAATVGQYAILQTFEHFRYTSGKGQLILQTFNFGGTDANALSFVGYSDGTDGIEFQANGTTLRFQLKSSTDLGTETVNQSAWNLDKLDGTGKSGITLDVSKCQILIIDFQALYVGRVRVGFDIGGVIYYAHEFNHANLTQYPYIKTANLPLRYGVEALGTVTKAICAVCSTVVQENGSSSNEGYHFSASGTATAASGARTHILSVQPKTTFNTRVNRAKFVLDSFEVVVTGSNPVKWELCLGNVLTGTTAFNDVNATYSTFAFNTAGTTSGTPAIVVASGFVAASAVNKGGVTASIPFRYPICLNAAGAVRDMARVTLLVSGIGGTSACQASINWKEIR